MKHIIEDLFKRDRQLLGEGFNSALDYINEYIPLEVYGIRSGTQVGDWTVPKEWIIRDGWIKFKGEKIVDYKKDPLSVAVYSQPVNKTVKLDELKKHLMISDECPNAYSYDYRFYDRTWGFTMPKVKVQQTTGLDTDTIKFENLMEEGEYEVFIDSEDKDGIMQIGVHTIPGKSDREILLFAHLDHPYQANDNLSGVACLMDLALKIKDRFNHTIKIIFCAETIGSIAYATKISNNLSKVDFVLAVDSIGNDNSLMFQKAFDKFDRLNGCVHLAVAGQGISYRKGDFRLVYGADEYYFNDPKVGIPGIFLTRLPFNEYHTSEDTPDKVLEEKLIEVQKVIIKTIDFYERDYIPLRHVKGPIMRSKHGVQANDRNLNRELDYLFYGMDGKKYLSEIILPLGIGFDFAYDNLSKLEKVGVITRKPKEIHEKRRPHIGKK